MASDKYFKTGSEIRLARLLDNDVKIIVPDLQRDYCWGNTPCQTNPNRTLACNFASDLIESFKKNEDTSLGLIYGYESPAGHLHLCDGQQRITTLYLLLGLLNRYTHTLEDRLMSQREMDDDKEPYLQYAIRESTLYFMIDLVNHCFMNEHCEINGIKSQPWYFAEYNYDPTINSMLCAMSGMEALIARLSEVERFQFAYFLCQKVRFIYYDMLSRRNGEETYVIINTRGETLTQAENLKPDFIANYGPQASQWWEEELESYFWTNRHNGNDTSDPGVQEFLRWVTLMKLVDGNRDKVSDTADLHDEGIGKSKYDELRKKGNFNFPFPSIDLDDLKARLRDVKRLFYGFGLDCKLLSPRNGAAPNQANWYRVIPAMVFLKKFPNATDDDVRRLCRFLQVTIWVDHVAKNVERYLPGMMRCVGSMQSPDILCLQNQPDFQALFKMLPEVNEIFTLCASAGNNRMRLENELWKAAGNDAWCGEVQPLLNWAKKASGTFSLLDFIKYRDTFDKIFGAPGFDLDLLRAMLVVNNAPNYPCHCEHFVSVRTNLCFGKTPKEWREIISKNEDVFGNILLGLSSQVDYEKYLTAQIGANASRAAGPYAPFAQHIGLLNLMGNKYVREENGEIILLKASYISNYAYLKSALWFEWAKTNANSLPALWILDKEYHFNNEGGCAHFEKQDQNEVVAIDVMWSPAGFYVDFYMLQGNASIIQIIQGLATAQGMAIDNKTQHYSILLQPQMPHHNVLNFVTKLMF